MEKIIEINRIIIMFIAVCFRYVSLYYSSSLLNYLLLFILFILTIFNIFHVKFEEKKFQKIFILLLLSAFIFFLNNEDSLFIYLTASLAFLDKDKNKTIKYFLSFGILAFLTTFISGRLGIIETITAGRYIDGETVYRNSLGFGNVNTPFIYFMGIIFGFYYFLRKKSLILFYILSTLIAFYLFEETDCRTGMYIYLIFVFVSLFYNEKINEKIKPLVPHLFLIFTGFSFLIAILFGGEVHNKINELLSNRPYFSNYYLENHLFINIFGHEITGSYILDNYYLSLLVKSGIVSYFTYFYIFKRGGKIISNDFKLVLILIFTFIYGILECNLYGNFIYIILLISIINEGDKNG